MMEELIKNYAINVPYMKKSIFLTYCLCCCILSIFFEVNRSKQGGCVIIIKEGVLLKVIHERERKKV